MHDGDVTNCAEVKRFLQCAWGLDGHWVVGVKVYAEYGCGSDEDWDLIGWARSMGLKSDFKMSILYSMGDRWTLGERTNRSGEYMESTAVRTAVAGGGAVVIIAVVAWVLVNFLDQCDLTCSTQACTQTAPCRVTVGSTQTTCDQGTICTAAVLGTVCESHWYWWNDCLCKNVNTGSGVVVGNIACAGKCVR